MSPLTKKMTRKHLTGAIRQTQRLLGVTPMQRVLHQLDARGVRLDSLIALEAFGGSGFCHTQDYASKVASLEVWEIKPDAEPALRRNLPRAKVQVTDTFEAMTRRKADFNFIVLDPPPTWPGSVYCEHFDLFPSVFGAAMPKCIILTNVIPHLPPGAKRLYPTLFDASHLERRRQFYQTNRPERVPLGKMTETYTRLAHAHGFTVDWWFSQKRTWFLHYLAFHIRRDDP